MQFPFAGAAIEDARSFDLTGGGLLLDRGGRRLLREGEELLDLEDEALAVRRIGDYPVLLLRGNFLLGLSPGAGRLGMPEGASALGVLPSATMIVGYDALGFAAHGVLFSRVGPLPLDYREPVLSGVRAIAVESGAFWLLGDGKAVRMRSGRSGMTVVQSIDLPAPADAAAVGPDGALYAACGDVLVRVSADRPDPPDPLPSPLRDLARHGASLLGLTPAGLVDLTEFVPAPDGDGPAFDLPACST